MKLHGSIYLKDKEASIPEVKKWLLATYEVKTGAMVPKKSVYDAYRDFCARSEYEPMDVSSFGKIFKRVLPEVERKRLVKGWHYCNLALRADAAVQFANNKPHNSPSMSSTINALTHQYQTTEQPYYTYPGFSASSATIPTNASTMDRLYHSDPIVPTLSSRRRDGTIRSFSPTPAQNSPVAQPRHSRSPSPISMMSRSSTSLSGMMPPAPSASPSISPLSSPRVSASIPSNVLRAGSPVQFPATTSPIPSSASQHQPTLITPTAMQPSSPRVIRPQAHPMPVPGSPFPPGSHSQPTYIPVHQVAYSALPQHMSYLQQQPQHASIPSSGLPYSPQHVRHQHAFVPTEKATSPSLPQHIWRGEDVPRQEVARSAESSWSTGAQLHLLSEIDYFITIYQRELWGFYPVNPSALDIEYLRYIHTDEGFRERSPRVLGGLFALSAGSTLAGDLRRGRDYLQRLRLRISDMFDVGDYDVGCVLHHVCFLCRLHADDEREGLSKGIYYLTLSQNVFEKIGAVNDEVYLMTLRLRNIYEGTDNEEVIKRAMSQPRWRKHWHKNYPFIENYKYGRITEMVRDHLFVVMQKITTMVNNDFKVPNDVSAILEGVRNWEAELDRLQDLYGSSVMMLKTMRALATLLRITCYASCNQLNEALDSSLNFMRSLLELPPPNQAICLIELGFKVNYMKSLISTLLHFNRFDKLQDLSTIAHRLASEFGTINKFRSFLLESLSAYQRQIQADLLSGQSMPASSRPSGESSPASDSPTVTVTQPPFPSAFASFSAPSHAMPPMSQLLPPPFYVPEASTPQQAETSAQGMSVDMEPHIEIADSDDADGLHAYISSFLSQEAHNAQTNTEWST